MPQCLAILPTKDSLNNMIVPHVKHSIPEMFATFQLILNHYKKEVQGKDIGVGTKCRQHLIVAKKKRFTRMKHIVRVYARRIESHSSTVSHEEVIM